MNRIMALALSLVGLAGCAREQPKQAPGVNVTAPGVNIQVDKGGVDVKAPGVQINVPK
jgi:hypothetical protein